MEKHWLLSVYTTARVFDFGPYETMSEAKAVGMDILEGEKGFVEGFVERLRSALFSKPSETHTWINPAFIEAIDVEYIE